MREIKFRARDKQENKMITDGYKIGKDDVVIGSIYDEVKL